LTIGPHSKRIYAIQPLYWNKTLSMNAQKMAFFLDNVVIFFPYFNQVRGGEQAGEEDPARIPIAYITEDLANSIAQATTVPQEEVLTTAD
jgi:hypothetical protein